MTPILKSIYAFVAGIVTVVITFLLVKNKKEKKVISTTDKQISDNKTTADNAQGHIEAVEDQKQDVKTDIEHREEIVKDLKDKAETIQPNEVTDVTTAKENIIRKTKRGRKPKNKKS